MSDRYKDGLCECKECKCDHGTLFRVCDPCSNGIHLQGAEKKCNCGTCDCELSTRYGKCMFCRKEIHFEGDRGFIVEPTIDIPTLKQLKKKMEDYLL